MRKLRFTDSQVMEALKRVESWISVRDLGISTATFVKGSAKCGGMDASMMSKMKQL